jgi:hypothetical protein
VLSAKIDCQLLGNGMQGERVSRHCVLLELTECGGVFVLTSNVLAALLIRDEVVGYPVLTQVVLPGEGSRLSSPSPDFAP